MGCLISKSEIIKTDIESNIAYDGRKSTAEDAEIKIIEFDEGDLIDQQLKIHALIYQKSNYD